MAEVDAYAIAGGDDESSLAFVEREDVRYAIDYVRREREDLEKKLQRSLLRRLQKRHELENPGRSSMLTDRMLNMCANEIPLEFVD
jgi:hypothetical protein